MSGGSVWLTVRSSPPLFSANLVSTAALQDAMVTTTTPGGQRVSICTCTRMGRHLATFTRRPRLFCGTAATVTPPCHAFVACTPVFLSLVYPGLCLPFYPRQPLPAFFASRGGSAPLLTLPNRGGEFSSDLLRDFCHGEGILQSFTLPDSPQQNGIAERRIGLVMEVTRTPMIHAAAPPFLWPFAVRYAAHQLNLWPRVSLPETSPTLRWTGEVGDVSVFRFYHPTLRRVLPSQDVTFDESVPYYRLFPYRSSPPPPPPLFLASGPPPVDPLPPQIPAPSGVSQVDPLHGTAPVEVAVGSGAPRGAASGGAASGGAELGVG
ncbi:unnamed protein product [Closterium sp. NIES-53]